MGEKKSAKGRVSASVCVGNWQTAIEAKSIARIVIGSTWSTTNSSGSRDKVRGANGERARERAREKERVNGNSHLVEQFKLR